MTILREYESDMMAERIENEYAKMIKWTKPQLREILQLSNSIGDYRGMSKDAMVTEHLTRRHGKSRMNAWRETYC